MRVSERIRSLSDLQRILMVACANAVVLILWCGGLKRADTPSYLAAWDYIRQGSIDLWRTPIYPVVLGLFKELFGDPFYMKAVAVFQHVMFLFSVSFFYKIAKRLFASRRVVAWVTLAYALFPCFTMANCGLLTESLSISLSVFMLYSTYKMVDEASVKHTSIYVLWAFVLLFLRPSFVYLVPISLVLAIVAGLRRKIRIALVLLSGVFVIFSCYVGYSIAFERKHGIFATSCVGTFNQYFIARRYNLVDVEAIRNPDMKAYVLNSIKENGSEIDDNMKRFAESYHLIGIYGIVEMQNAVMSTYRKNPKLLVVNMGMRFKTCSTSNPFPTDKLFVVLYGILHLLGFNYGLLYLFFIVYTFILVRHLYRYKTIPLFISFVYMAAFSNLIVSVIGAEDDVARLTLPSYSYILLLLTLLLVRIRDRLRLP